MERNPGVDRSRTERESIKVVYITSLGHSGSTLMDMLISSHSQVVSVGEAHQIGRAPDTTPCRCGVRPGLTCPFWRAVAEDFEKVTSVPFNQIDLEDTTTGHFEEHNVAFYTAVCRVSGKRIIVDSSKNLSRLVGLLQTPGLTVKPIHLIRDPRGVIWSSMRKGKNWVYASLQYNVLVARTHYALRSHGITPVHYEDLTSDPMAVLEPLMKKIGLDVEETQLNWTSGTRHNFGGNEDTGGSGDRTIKPDITWRSRLTRLQQAGIKLLTLPARWLNRPVRSQNSSAGQHAW